MYEEFIKWLNNELNNRNWSLAELGRQSGISHGGISEVLAGKARPTERFCIRVAKALGVSPDLLLKMAGYDINLVDSEKNSLLYQQLIDEAKFLEDDELDKLVSYTRWIRATTHAKVWQEDRLKELE